MKKKVRFGNTPDHLPRVVVEGVRADETPVCPPHHYILRTEGGEVRGTCKKCRTAQWSAPLVASAGEMPIPGHGRRPLKLRQDDAPGRIELGHYGFHLD